MNYGHNSTLGKVSLRKGNLSSMLWCADRPKKDTAMVNLEKYELEWENTVSETNWRRIVASITAYPGIALLSSAKSHFFPPYESHRSRVPFRYRKIGWTASKT